MKSIDIVFLLKFNYQIKRIRPEVYDLLLGSLTSFAKDAGARIKRERRFISFFFNEDELCFSLDMLLFVEQIKKFFLKISGDTYGWNVVITRNSSLMNLDELFRSFPIGEEFFFGAEGSIWCAKDIVNIFTDLVDFGAALSFAEDSPFKAAEDFTPILDIKQNQKKYERFSAKKKIIHLLEEKSFENTLLSAPPFSGKSEILEEFVFNTQNDFPPIFIQFDNTSAGLGCFSLAFNSDIKNIFNTIKVPEKELEELSHLASIIEKDFLRSECSVYLAENSIKMFNLLFSNYIHSAKLLQKHPMFVLLNIENATYKAEEIFFSAYEGYLNKNEITLYGTTSAKKISQRWLSLFKQVFAIQGTDTSSYSNDFPPTLPDVLYEASYMVSLLIKYFPSDKCKELFENQGKSSSFINYVFSNLAEYGIIKEGSCTKILYGDLEKIAEEKLEKRGEYIRAIAGGHLIKWAETEKLNPSFDFITALFSLGCKIEDKVLLDAVLGDIYSDTYKKIEKSIKDGSFLQICGEKRGEALMSVFKTLKVLSYGNEKEVHSVFSKMQIEDGGAKMEPHAYTTTEYAIDALYRLGIGDNTKALQDAKDSLALSQYSHKDETLSRVYRIMALISLSYSEVSEAQDYIKFAKNISRHGSQTNESVLNSYYAAVIYFLLGNISKSMQEIEEAKKEALNYGRMDWFIKSEFFAARLLFEIGNYEGAQDILKKLLSDMCNDQENPAYKIIYAWHYRCNVYLGGEALEDINKENDLFQCEDFDFFEIEALYFTGNYDKAVKKADAFIKNVNNASFQFVERPDWSSGYSGIELLVFKKRDFFARLAEIYAALSICNSGSQAEKLAAVESIEHSLRKNPPAVLNPDSHFIYYAYYRMLEDVSRNDVDKNTAISMAFKRLQNRASKIDDINIKRSFLDASYWNKLLSSAAVKHKLI